MDEDKELALRKYAELYEHSKAVLAEEMARSSRADEKASKYLTDQKDTHFSGERRQCFDDRFVQLARQVYFGNDQRAAIKRQINTLLGSALVEEKSYQAYGGCNCHGATLAAG